jgi:predicted transposase/invertase (TIGR01784 family)
MSLLEKWRDIQFHKNLWKADEQNLFEQARIDGHAQGREEGLAQGMAEGHAEGLIEGIAKDKIEVAKNALVKGLSVEMIHEITGLDIETIRSL